MANSKASTEFTRYATVDSAPGADGYWTDPVSFDKRLHLEKVFFSIRETDPDASAASSITVTLQFRCKGGLWQDYNTTTAFAAGDRKVIEDGAGGVDWRAGVKSGAFSSGSLTFGFDW